MLRIDTGAWDVIGVMEYISCSPLHTMTCYIPYERSIFSCSTIPSMKTIIDLLAKT